MVLVVFIFQMRKYNCSDYSLHFLIRLCGFLVVLKLVLLHKGWGNLETIMQYCALGLWYDFSAVSLTRKVRCGINLFSDHELPSSL